MARPGRPGKIPLFDFDVIARINLAQAEGNQHGRGVGSGSQHDSLTDVLSRGVGPVIFLGGYAEPVDSHVGNRVALLQIKGVARRLIIGFVLRAMEAEYAE